MAYPGKNSAELYHRTQIDLTYNSNRIEGSKLTHDQTRYIFEYLLDTCLTAQDNYKAVLRYFEIGVE